MYTVSAIIKILLKNTHNLKFAPKISQDVLVDLFTKIEQHFPSNLSSRQQTHARSNIISKDFDKELVHWQSSVMYERGMLYSQRGQFLSRNLDFVPGYMIYEPDGVSSVNSMKRVFVLTAEDTKESVVLSIFWNPQNP